MSDNQYVQQVTSINEAIFFGVDDKIEMLLLLGVVNLDIDFVSLSNLIEGCSKATLQKKIKSLILRGWLMRTSSVYTGVGEAQHYYKVTIPSHFQLVYKKD